jgi:hypothetical protein
MKGKRYSVEQPTGSPEWNFYILVHLAASISEEVARNR